MLLLLLLLLLREGRDLDGTVAVVVGVASANVARAGVEGLLARPLLVLTVLIAGVGCMTRAADSFFCSSIIGVASDATAADAALVALSFLLPLRGGSSTGGGISISCFGPSGLLGARAGVSLCAFGPELAFAPLLCWLGSSISCGFPFGLVEASDGSRCRVFSTLDCVEFCRAREDCGRGGAAAAAAAAGTGESLLPLVGSEKVPITGEDVIDGDIAALILLGSC